MLEHIEIYIKEIEPNELGEKYQLGLNYTYRNRLYGRIFKTAEYPTVETVIEVLNILFNQQINAHLNGEKDDEVQ
jgi:hypothetical protein